VDPHPYLEVQPAPALELLSISPDAFQDLQPGQDRPLRVVFMRNRRAEESQDAIPSHLCHRSAVAAYGFGQIFQGMMDGPGPHFGVELLGHGGGAFDVAEQDGDNTTFACRRIGELCCGLGACLGLSVQFGEPFAKRCERLFDDCIAKDAAFHFQRGDGFFQLLAFRHVLLSQNCVHGLIYLSLPSKSNCIQIYIFRRSYSVIAS